MCREPQPLAVVRRPVSHPTRVICPPNGSNLWGKNTTTMTHLYILLSTLYRVLSIQRLPSTNRPPGIFLCLVAYKAHFHQFHFAKFRNATVSFWQWGRMTFSCYRPFLCHVGEQNIHPTLQVVREACLHSMGQLVMN